MKPEKTIGLLLIAGATGVLIPYTILTMTFDYPDILRQDTGTILTRFHAQKIKIKGVISRSDNNEATNAAKYSFTQSYKGRKVAKKCRFI